MALHPETVNGMWGDNVFVGFGVTFPTGRVSANDELLFTIFSGVQALFLVFSVFVFIVRILSNFVSDGRSGTGREGEGAARGGPDG